MSLIQAKQINKMLLAAVGVAAFTTSVASSDTFTSALTAALGTAGAGGVSVPLQVGSSTTEGVAVSAPYNVVPVYLSGYQKERAQSADGADIYAKITHSGGVYTLSYFTAAGGTEAAYTWTSATAIDVEIPYYFTFEHLPTEAIVSVRERHVNDDAGSSNGIAFAETLTVTAANTLSALSKSAKATAPIWFTVNGQVVKNGEGITAVGTAVTVTAGTLGFSIATTDVVDAFYFY